MLDLAGGASDGRPDMLGPAPAWLIRRSAENGWTDVVDLEAALLELPHLGRCIEVDHVEALNVCAHARLDRRIW